MGFPKFSKTGYADIELAGFVNYPMRRPLEKIQVIDRTAGGTLQVEDLGVTTRRFPLDLVLLDQSTYDQLEMWFDDVADGALTTFTYLDEDGTAYTVACLTSTLDFQENPPGRFSGQILLEVIS